MHVYFTFITGLLKSVYLFIFMGYSNSYEGRLKSQTSMQIRLVTTSGWLCWGSLANQNLARAWFTH